MSRGRDKSISTRFPENDLEYFDKLEELFLKYNALSEEFAVKNEANERLQSEADDSKHLARKLLQENIKLAARVRELEKQPETDPYIELMRKHQIDIKKTMPIDLHLSEKEKLEKEIVRLSGELNSLQKELETSQAELSEFQNINTQCFLALKIVNEEKEGLQKKLDASELANIRLQRENGQLKAKIETDKKSGFRTSPPSRSPSVCSTRKTTTNPLAAIFTPSSSPGYSPDNSTNSSDGGVTIKPFNKK